MCFQENILPRDLVTANRVWCSFVKGLPYLCALNKTTFIQCLLQVYSQGPRTVRNSHSQNEVCIHNCLTKIKPFHTKNIRVFQNMVFSCLFLILHAFPAVPLQSTPKKTTENFTGCQTLDHQFCHQLLQTTTTVAFCCATLPSTGQCRVEHCGTRSVVDGPPYRGEDGAK